MPRNKDSRSAAHAPQNIQSVLFRSQLLLIVPLALLLATAGLLLNLHLESVKRDQNLQNVAQSIAHSQLLTDARYDPRQGVDARALADYLDSLQGALSSIDIISVVALDQVRLYHSNHDLIGLVYDGTLPDFEQERTGFYTADDSGPSGRQRRAYAAIYRQDGSYAGFVLAITLMENIREETLRTLASFTLITLAIVLLELLLSSRLARRIKAALLGYEPDVFSAMYQVRDNILESLDEGVLAVDCQGRIQFANRAAAAILGVADARPLAGRSLEELHGEALLEQTLRTGEKELGVQTSSFPNADILIDRVPILENGAVAGAIGILHNRTEYAQLMEDLAGTRYLVDSMRANNHDFTNKLHVILGLIQMEMYDQATAYIQSITILQRESISTIMNAIHEPAVAALLIGKTARASELNIRFTLRENCAYNRDDFPLPAEALVTIIGNLIDNALDAMNGAQRSFEDHPELLVGLFSQPGALLITVDDTGPGILPEHLGRLFDNGFSTKGSGRGTGLYQVRKLVERFGGSITVESQKDSGASFTVSFPGKA